MAILVTMVLMQLCFNRVSDSNEVDSLIKRGKDTQMLCKGVMQLQLLMMILACKLNRPASMPSLCSTCIDFLQKRK